MTYVRAFIAVPLPDTLLDSLGALQRTLERRVPAGSVRWVRPQGIHLTLKFLGDTPTHRLPDIEAALRAIARHAPAFDLSVAGTGCFPNSRRPRVIWVGLEEPSGRLERLQLAIEEAMEVVGFPPEGRGFRPHLTLGRTNRRATRAQTAGIGEAVTSTALTDLGDVLAGRIALIRSVLKPTGAEYTTLSEFPLQTA